MADILGSYASTLTPLQLTAGASLLQNQGLRVAPSVTANIAAYNSVPIVGAYQTVISLSGVLNSTNKAALTTLSSGSCPALTNTIPAYYQGLGTFNLYSGYTYLTGLSGIIATKANLYLGSPTGKSTTNYDYSRFCQIFQTCEGYAQTANQFILSGCNADNYLCDTFTNQDNSVTGSITQVTSNTSAFGQDLAKLGNLWDLSNLDNLGSPLALAQQIFNVIGIIPALAIAFTIAGVPDDVINNLNDPNYDVSDTAQKAMYTAYTQVTGTTLSQILQLLGVTTSGITTMADLLNPIKLFPNSYSTLTTVTKNGTAPIYVGNSVNTTLVQTLPPYELSSTV